MAQDKLLFSLLKERYAAIKEYELLAIIKFLYMHIFLKVSEGEVLLLFKKIFRTFF